MIPELTAESLKTSTYSKIFEFQINDTATINGIGGNLTTNVIGTFHNRHDVYYHPDAVANILSQSAEKDNGATIHYDNDKD